MFGDAQERVGERDRDEDARVEHDRVPRHGSARSVGSATAGSLERAGVVGWRVVVEAKLAGFLGHLVECGAPVGTLAGSEVDEIL